MSPEGSATLASPAITLFGAWLLSYVFEPPVAAVVAATESLRQRDVLLRATGDEPPMPAPPEEAASGSAP